MDKIKHHWPKPKRGGARPNSGRPRKDTDIWGQITCVLRKDTIQKLKEGSGGKMKHFGLFLQYVLDRHPMPEREAYLQWKTMQKLDGKAAQPSARLAWEKHIRQTRAEKKRQEREAREWAEATPRQRAMIRTLQKLQKEDAKKLAAK